MHFGQPAEIFGVDGIIILIVVVLVLFGSTQIPKLARSLGSAQKEFKKGIEEGGEPDPKAGTSTAAAVQPTVIVAQPPVTVTPPPVAAAPPPADSTPGGSS